MEELKENICKEIANIPAEQVQSVNQNPFPSVRNVYV
jgi:hypothetical protein